MSKKPTAPRIAPQSAEHYPTLYPSLNAGLEYTLDAFPALYRRTLHGLKGRFEKAELLLILDVFNGLVLTPGLAGQQIGIQVSDGIALDKLNEKWVVDGQMLEAKLEDLHIFDRACLEIWAAGYWKKETEAGAWVQELL